jgi:hypothetical protein
VTPALARGTERATSLLAFPLLVWLLWRLGHAVVLVVAGGHLTDDTFAFDGGWFLTVLERGYSVTDPSFDSQQNVAFFPGLVWLTEPASWLIGDRAAAILITNLTAASAFVAVHGATRCACRSRLVARNAVIALAVWPASVVMTAYYSEGLFLTLTALAIWGAARGRDAMGGFSALLAATTRSIGFLLGPVLAIVRVVDRRRLDRTAIWYAVSGPIGLGVVAFTQALTVDDATAFASAQRAWDRSLSAPWVPIWRAIDGIVDKLPTPALELGLNLAAIVLVGVALAVVTRRHRAARSAWGFLVWGWVAWLAPLLTTVPSSQVRFGMAAWPALAVVGQPSGRWARRAWFGGAIVAVVLSIVLVSRWADGEFIG